MYNTNTTTTPETSAPATLRQAIDANTRTIEAITEQLLTMLAELNRQKQINRQALLEDSRKYAAFLNAVTGFSN